MVQSLEAIKGGGGSIRVGTTGTISSLMTRELASMKAAPQKSSLSSSSSSSSSSRNKPQAVPSSTSYGTDTTTTPRRQQPRKSSDEASSSGITDFSRKTKAYSKNTHRIPMLGSDNIRLDSTPSREKADKKGPSNIVEVVDIKCGNSDRAWTSPITSKLRKLGFSKLSESII